MTDSDRQTIAIVPTGGANLASVRAGLERAGASVTLTTEVEHVASCAGVVLPGVGAFGDAMRRLEAIPGLIDAIRDRVQQGRPTLCVCLGMQLLGRQSDESPVVGGLGVVEAKITRWPTSSSLSVPHMGWNQVEADPSCRFLTSGYAYFAHSFRATSWPDAWARATCAYGGRFVAAAERDNVLVCQFHPELSGAWGRALLKRWVDATRAAREAVTSC